ncbi:MAG: Tol-Pal system protein TolB [Verrucomicrobia bacterium]|nr:Tol-Pal system protein TolB [Verrucomicrobiota bacterium]
MFWLVLLFCLLATGSVQGVSSNEKIVVHLAKEGCLLPIVLSPISTSQTELSTEFQNALYQVLAFDLNHNGATKVLSSKEVASLPSLQGYEKFDQPLDFQKFEKDHLLYIVKLQIKGRELIAKIISVNAQTGTTINNILLTGNLAQDRSKIHRLADSIHKVLFGTEGVASCRILYTIKKQVMGSSQWVSEVFESDYDGANCRQLTHTHSYCAHPLYIPAPNGNKSGSFLYVSYKIGQPKIYLASLKDGREVRASALRGNQVTPAIYKDSSTIAFACDVTGKSDLFIQPLSPNPETLEKPRQIFTAKAAANASPSFSSDGKKIAFVSNKDGSPKIYVMEIPAPNMKPEQIKTTLISKRCRENSAPCWSPDGKKLAYCSRTSGPRQIWVYDFETGTERELTHDESNKENPFWAPDSLHLLYNATDAKSSEIMLINLNQPEAVQITSGPGFKLFASWEPKNL